MKAHETISKLRDKFLSKRSNNDGYVADDNNEVIELLNNEAVHVREIFGQETWVMSDGSYITRLDEEYWVGDDIDLFDIEEELS